ncbi:NYN domain-containing protein [Selenomonas sp. TAMA-11512]|uniref:NYN domain-containing protein n=1 Tax=Selenomonas sp. TAMA-11512 TaxID=3095337 RepID=UPI003088E011|nr:NYN domain-containing protein [Selenomonas sp. TAMA-11512]
MRAGRKSHYLIDGYNVIHAWKELSSLMDDLSLARDRLVFLLSEYGAYERADITVVFDAPYTEEQAKEERYDRYLSIIYTGAGETADTVIERLAYALSLRKEVYVVTSDSAEQGVALGAGAYRIPSRELERRVKRVKKKLHRDYLGEVTLPLVRNEVGGRLDEETLKKLDALRKGF